MSLDSFHLERLGTYKQKKNLILPRFQDEAGHTIAFKLQINLLEFSQRFGNELLADLNCLVIKISQLS